MTRKLPTKHPYKRLYKTRNIMHANEDRTHDANSYTQGKAHEITLLENIDYAKTKVKCERTPVNPPALITLQHFRRRSASGKAGLDRPYGKVCAP